MITRTGDQIEVSGSMTMATINALYNEGLKSQGNSNMVVDFARVEKMDSSAVSLMLVWLREAQRENTALSFINVPENLMSLAKLYGVADLLPLNTAG